MRYFTRVLPSVASLVVAAASFALSFVALRDVAADVGAVPAGMAWLIPVVVDGGVICASAVIWANSQLRRPRELFPFAVTAVLLVVSMVINTAHAADAVLAKVIAALPPLVLLASLELVAGQNRTREPDPGRRRDLPTRPRRSTPTSAPATPAGQVAAVAEPAGQGTPSVTKRRRPPQGRAVRLQAEGGEALER